MRYFVKLAYDGSAFFGWQVQPNHSTVQETLEKAFSLLLKEDIALTGCGRTDTGVHAKEYFAHFDSEQVMERGAIEQLVFRLNSFLPKEIVIFDIYSMPENAHARFDATARSYNYYINLNKDPFTSHYAHRVFEQLDIEMMNEASKILLNTTDFTSFSKVHTQVNNFNCKVTEACWQLNEGQLVFTITADRFLRNMVRAVVGTVLLVGKGKISLSEFQDVIDKKDRCEAGTSVPAHALFLEKIRYPYPL